MTAPYKDSLAAIRAALNVDARCLYTAQSWQQYVTSGYRISTDRGDLSKEDSFKQDCITLAFLNHRMPAAQWAALIVNHALKSQGDAAERDRLRWAVWTLAGLCGTGDTQLDRWYVLRWGGHYKGPEATWDSWQGKREQSVRTLRRHCETRTAPKLRDLLRQAEATAERLLADGGLIQKVAA